MKVLVTGATGFLGREIVKELLANNFEVIGIGRTKSVDINIEQIDITNEIEVKKLNKLIGVDVIIHSAGLAHQFGKTSREDFFRVNVKGTENIANLAKVINVRHFILISSVSVYGKAKTNFNNFEFQENLECYPIGDYAESKFAAEKIAENLCSDITLTILRPATIIGEGDKGNVNRLIQSIDNNRFIKIGKCVNYKTLVDKNYVAQICIKVIENKTTGTYNVANEPIQISEILQTIYTGLNKNMSKYYVPTKLAEFASKFVDFILGKTISATIDKWIEDDIFSQKKLESTLGIKSQINVKSVLTDQVRTYLANK
jgi:nucleoside-diphosphate-sugar epimerase